MTPPVQTYHSKYIAHTLSLLTVYMLLACSTQHAEKSASASTDVQPAAAGDLGPPQGAPIHATLTSAPAVPPAIRRKSPARVIVELEVREVVLPMADGVEYAFWTFGGSVPGKFIRVRQGDTVEFHLKNHPDSKMPHNIDLHAVTGPGGGAGSSFTAPGHETQFTFKALKRGLFVYHCATAPVGMHIANGMYGMILVEPPEGLPPVDREYYVMQGDFYTAGKHGEGGLQAFDMEKAIDEKPTYVLFNGADGALMGDKALKVRTGERVRLFVGNGGPNLVSSFHVIGEIFDRVYTEGGTHVQENVQTTLVPAGGAAIVEFKAEVPGTYALVDHSIFRAFSKGAIGTIVVEGAAQKEVFSGNQADVVYHADNTPAAGTPDTAETAPGEARSKDAQIAAGRAVFQSTCAACHQADGKGLANVFPPLSGSSVLKEDPKRAITIALNGLTGPIEVNGQTFNGAMPSMSHLGDEQLANVITYVLNEWNNPGGQIQPQDIADVRARSKTLVSATP